MLMTGVNVHPKWPTGSRKRERGDSRLCGIDAKPKADPVLRVTTGFGRLRRLTLPLSLSRRTTWGEPLEARARPENRGSRDDAKASWARFPRAADLQPGPHR